MNDGEIPPWAAYLGWFLGVGLLLGLFGHLVYVVWRVYCGYTD
jgi:hypothetical protein